MSWLVMWYYRIEISYTSNMEDLLFTDKLDPWEDRIDYLLSPGEVYYIRSYIIRSIRDNYGNTREDETLKSKVYKIEGFDYSEVGEPPKHEGPIDRKVSDRGVEDQTGDGFVVIE